jgi:hypothetical protein
MSTARKTAGDQPWWQTRAVPEGRTLHLTLGPLDLAIGRSRPTWLIRIERQPEADSESRLKSRVARRLPEPYDERFVQAADDDSIRLEPVLADRSIVIRPRQPIHLPGHEEITLYLSTPVYLRILAGSPPVLLREVPSLILSDTWFGPSTQEGELCYAGRTQARYRIEELPLRPHRAITPLLIRNRADTILPLEKISLPVPMLSLYGAADASLWTQRVTLVREGSSDLAKVRVDPEAPDLGVPIEKLAGARQDPSRSGLVRAFSVLFGS